MAGTGYTTALVGNALIAGARLCPRDGFRRMYDSPWTDHDLSAPELFEVEFPAVLVREAVYPDDALLRVILAPGRSGSERQTVAVRGLDLGKARIVLVDGTPMELAPEADEVSAGGIDIRADRAAGVLRMSLTVDRDRRIEFR